MSGNIVKIWKKLSEINDTESNNITQRLVDIEFSKRHGHEICIIQLVNKNAFPKMTPQEILSDDTALLGMSKRDIIEIARLAERIKYREDKNVILEYDVNGTIELMNSRGDKKRYSERKISKNEQLLTSLSPRDAHDIGYRLGFKDGFASCRNKLAKAKSKVSKIINIFW